MKDIGNSPKESVKAVRIKKTFSHFVQKGLLKDL